MKKIIFCLVIAMGLSAPGYAIAPADSTDTAPEPAITKLASAVKDLAGIVTEMQKEATPPAPECANGDKDLDWQNGLLVSLPVLLFISVLFLTFWAAKRAGYNFSQALYAEDPETITMAAPTPADPKATVTVTLLDKDGMPVFYPSSSRLIAFLTALVSLSVISCLISYYAYCMVKGCPSPDFKHLLELFAALGLGIVPYGINKFTSAKPDAQ